MSFLSDADIVIKGLLNYFQESTLNKGQVINQKPLSELVDDFNLETLVNTGGLSDRRLKTFLDRYLLNTTRLHSPAYLAHQVSIPHYSGALGSLIDGFTNNPMSIYEMGPGATAIEYFLINWLLKKVGWRPAPYHLKSGNGDEAFGGGILTHGGSLSNLTALIAARNNFAPDAWTKGNPKDLAILAPKGAHYSIARAAGIIGIGHDAVVPLDVDKSGAVIPDKIHRIYERIINEGKRPFVLVANGCSTAVGIYDPLDEIGEWCQKYRLWFHVDGAHGASVLLSQKYKALLNGVEKADSLTWDAHKLMRVPTLCAILLVQDHRHLDSAFKQEASYIFHDKEQPGFDFIHRTVECTKAGLGLRLFMVLASLGEQGLSKYIDRQIELTADAYEFISNLSNFDCPVKPQCNILCFRVNGSDESQLKIRDELTKTGEFYISSTLFNDKRYLRLSIMNPDTDLDVIKKLVQRISTLAGEMDH